MSEISQPEWLRFLSPAEWNTLAEMQKRIADAGIETMLGGALALAAYTPLKRSTKDLDFYVHPDDRDQMVEVLHEAGFADLFYRLPYDRGWIYRSERGDVIVDVIWRFANYLTEVDEEWFRHSRSIPCGPFTLRILPPEELLWAKLYVFQRDRTDWPDLLNLLYYQHDKLDWERLRRRVGKDDAPLLESLETVFRWLCPNPPEFIRDRVERLDKRDWFLPAFTTDAPPRLS